ncbi:ATP-dependent RNA helicase [Tilletia horrida]|nr:ATP-dependent RNA helicase [Tilletia horrida]
MAGKKELKTGAAASATAAAAPGARVSTSSAPTRGKKRKAAPIPAEDEAAAPETTAAADKKNKRVKKNDGAAAATAEGDAQKQVQEGEPGAPLSKRAAKFLKLQQKKLKLKLKQKQKQKAKQPKTQASTAAASSSGAEVSSASSAGRARKQVKVSALTWKPVALPTEAASGGGASTTDADFFAGLFDGDLDDYMGLQEVSGVRVKYAPAAAAAAANSSGSAAKSGGASAEADGADVDGDDMDVDEDENNKRGKVIQFLVADEPEDADDAVAEDQPAQAGPSQADGAGDASALAEDGGAAAALPGPALSKQQKQKQKRKEKAATAKVAAAGAKEEELASGGSTTAVQAEEDKAGEGVDLLAHVNWAALDSFDESKLPGWSRFDLDTRLKAGLWKLKFAKPTKIQAATLPYALGRRSSEGADEISQGGKGKRKANDVQNASDAEDEEEEEEEDGDGPLHRDVVGVAQTGSGKTLAYGLPILHHFLSAGAVADPHENGEAEDVRPLTALILTPTRELAIQVGEHLQALVDAAGQVGALTEQGGAAAAAAGEKKHWVSIVTVCGGMSVQKQRRLLTRGQGADIVVATPGRLWELLSEDDDFAARMKQIRFLVIDEADRMVEVGHFAEMDNILKIVRRPGEAEEVGDAFVEEMPASLPLNSIAQSFVAKFQGGREDLQTFVFSATLSKNLQRNLTRAKRKTLSRKKKAETSTLDDLMMRVDFRDPDPLVVDLSPEAGIAEGVHEMKVECLTKDKDLYLYYFLLRYPGRTLVFLNSIDGIRRLVPILTHLGLHPFPLHSQLQQKQRLKNLDRFRAVNLSQTDANANANANAKTGAGKMPASAVILATDVAARGLDIKGVDHVVHYQLPRSADTYVHRSGRTGRAGTEGVALAMIDPAEKRVWMEICKSLNRKDSIPSMTVEFSFFDPLRARLDLARQIDNAEHRASKESHDDAWLRKMAEEADIDLEQSDGPDDDDGGGKKGKGNSGKKGRGSGGGARVGQLKEELEVLLRQPLKARGVSFKYITSGSRSNFAVEALNTSRRDVVTDAPKLLHASKAK